MTEESKQGLPILELPGPDAWERWLEEHHAASSGVWLKFAKKGSGVRTVVYAEALQAALCFGWIDGQVGRYDAVYYLQRFTPRTKRSKWSKINVGHAQTLIEAGRMRPAGLAEVQAAQADGRWEAAYASPSNITVPDDLAAALAAAPEAQRYFATLTGSARYAFLYRLANVKRPETRARRIADYIERLNAGRTLQD